jgi:hypothetical protein
MPATTKKLPFPEEKALEASNGMPKYVRCNLTNEQKEEMIKWANSSENSDLIDMMVSAINAGYVFSWKESAINGNIFFQSSLTMQKKEKIQSNSGMCLVTRASSAEKAVWSLFFRHEKVLDKNWSSLSTSEELEW